MDKGKDIDRITDIPDENMVEISHTQKTKKLKFWWIPQIPMKKFEYDVNTPLQAAILYDAFAKYDLFQYKNNIKPDYANAGGLLEYDEENEEWVDWCDEDEGIDFRDFLKNMKF